MRTVRLLLLVTLVVSAAAVAVRLISPPAERESHEILREVYSPRFARVPDLPPAGETLAQVRETLRGPAGVAFLRRWLPSQSGTLWIFAVMTVVISFDFARPRHPRNVDMMALLVLGALFFDILFFARHLREPFWLQLLWWVFDAIVAVTVFIGARAIWRVYHPVQDPWTPNLPRRALAVLAVLMLLLDASATLLRPPDDSGYFANLGAQRLRERWLLPYGDPMLTGTPGAAYAPLLYVAHIPFQWLVDPIDLNATSSPHPPLGVDSTYRLPSALATKLCALAFLFVGVFALFRAATRFGSVDLGYALVAMFCGSAFVIGMGGEDYFIGGVTYVSHLAPPALTTAAFATLANPIAAGVLLTAGAGVGFYPAFLVPAWLGYYSSHRGAAVRFLGSITVSSAILGAFVLLRSRPTGGRGLIGTILWDTLGHHTDSAGYGSSPFSFWGQRPGWREWFANPLVGASGLTAPMMLLFIGFALAAYVIARRRTPQMLALISAAVVIGATLVKIHPTAGYVAWFYPFLLLGLFLPAAQRSARAGTP
ncbi:MAG TPA: hypothetical protein VK886_09895 [Vicinamibacterales bacterium]|nr:hypothetical protein [Vicinamibacterales bacterium]